MLGEDWALLMVLGSVVSDGNSGSGTAVVRATLISGVAEGVTTGRDCGGGVVARGGVGLLDEAVGLYSMGGSSPPMFVIPGSAAGSRMSSTGWGPGLVLNTRPTTMPSRTTTAPMEVIGKGRPGRTAGGYLPK